MYLYDKSRSLEECIRTEPNHRLQELMMVYGHNANTKARIGNGLLSFATASLSVLTYILFSDTSENREITKIVLTRSPALPMTAAALTIGWSLKKYDLWFSNNRSEIYNIASHLLKDRDPKRYDKALDYLHPIRRERRYQLWQNQRKKHNI